MRMDIGSFSNMEYHWKTPVSPQDIRQAHIGGIIYLTGTLFTARDRAHQKLLGLKPKDIPFKASELPLYHCGPLVKKSSKGWEVISAGPTTSSRMNLFEEEIIKKLGITFIIG